MNQHGLTLFKYLETVCSSLKAPLQDGDLKIVEQLYSEGATASQAITSIDTLVSNRNITFNKYVWDN